MPYRKSSRVTLSNFGKEPVNVKLKAVAGDWQWDQRSMCFHANWRQQYPVITQPPSDWNYIEIKGKGVYVGDVLTTMAPIKDWWGEGDEKVYVDGEKLPSHFGTGLEDYYGFAWGLPPYFEGPFQTASRLLWMEDEKNIGQHTGHTTVSRVMTLDAIPFRKSLRFDKEVWSVGKKCEMAWAAATYWYARPGATSNRSPMPEQAARPVPWPPGMLRIKGAIECEKIEISDKTEAVTTVRQQMFEGFTGKWSEGAHLFIEGGKAGDFVELSIPVKSAGPWKLTVYATKGPEYGIIRFAVDGKIIDKTRAMFSEKLVPAEPIELGVFEAVDDILKLRVEIAGPNTQSRGSGIFCGLDCVVLTAEANSE